MFAEHNAQKKGGYVKQLTVPVSGTLYSNAEYISDGAEEQVQVEFLMFQLWITSSSKIR